MNLTIDFLKEKHACAEGMVWFQQSQCRTMESTLEKLDAEKNWLWAKWLMVRVLDRDDLTRMAIFSAKLVLHIYEEKYPSDPRPRSAIDAAELYLLTKAPEDLKKCKVANAACVTASNDAAYAYAAAYAAAAYNYATYAAAAAYAACAAYVVDATGVRESRTQIIQHVISLIKKYPKEAQG